MENKNTLNGFEAMFDSLAPMNVGEKGKKEDEQDLMNLLGGADEELTDEELEALRNPKPKKNTKKVEEEEETEEEEEEVEETKTTKKSTKKVEVKEEVEEEEEENTEDTTQEGVITGFFDTLAETIGWDDVDEEEKPKTVEALIEYFKEVIEENSTPEYANEEMQKLDEFVRNGGKLMDYLSIDAPIDLENVDIDEESDQKLIIKEFLKEKGISVKSIEKKLAKYEEAGLLEDEATDALEALKEIREQRKEELLANQQKQAAKAQKEQQDFFNNVVQEIKGMDSIHGLSIPEKDKKALLEYIFKPDTNGQTKYQKDYAKSLKNLITSAYFTMKGDTIIDVAKKKGKREALDNFKNTLSSNSGVNKKSKRQVTNTDGDTTTIWNAFARQLRAA